MVRDTTIIIPTYNEAENIIPFLKELDKYCPPNVAVLIVDDNSPDGTGKLVEEYALISPRIELISQAEKKGLGRAYVFAFKHLASRDHVQKIIMMDADFSHDPAVVPMLLEYAQDNHVIIGSRYVQGGSYSKYWEVSRIFISKMANLYAKWITGMPINDLTSGFLVVDKQHMLDVLSQSGVFKGYAFQIHLKYNLWKNGATIQEVPIYFDNRRGGVSKMSSHIVAEGIVSPWIIKYGHIWKK